MDALFPPGARAMAQSDGPTVSLVLGSGGARGLAHIGVIHYLEEQGYRIRSVSTCSIGAVIGGVYAAGKLDEYEGWVRAIDRMDILSLLDVSWEQSGLVKGERIIDTLRGLVGDRDIQDLPVRYTAVAADIRREKEIWIQSGSLFDAMRASMSLPLFFTPFVLDGTRLVDGGVLNPVPIAPTFSDRTDLTIAVNLGGRVQPSARRRRTPAREDEATSRLHAVIRSFIARLGEPRERGEERLSAYDVVHQSFDAMQATISRQKLAAYPPDCTITIPRSACGILEFDRAAEMIELGYEAAREQLPVSTSHGVHRDGNGTD